MSARRWLQYSTTRPPIGSERARRAIAVSRRVRGDPHLTSTLSAGILYPGTVLEVAECLCMSIPAMLAARSLSSSSDPRPRARVPFARGAAATRSTSRYPSSELVALQRGDRRPSVRRVVPARSEGALARGRGPRTDLVGPMKLAQESAKADLLARIRRIEGQARGIARMIEDGRECTDILQQLAAVRSAAHKATVCLVRAYAAQCMNSDGSPDEIAEALASAVARLA